MYVSLECDITSHLKIFNNGPNPTGLSFILELRKQKKTKIKLTGSRNNSVVNCRLFLIVCFVIVL